MSSSGRGAWRRERACSAAKARSCAKYAAESPSVPGARVCPARKSASPNVTSSSDARLPRSEERCPARKSASPNVPEHLHCSRPQTLAPALSMTAATSSLLLPSANAALPANIEAWSAAPSPCCQCLSISPRMRITAARRGAVAIPMRPHEAPPPPATCHINTSAAQCPPRLRSARTRGNSARRCSFLRQTTDDAVWCLGILLLT